MKVASIKARLEMAIERGEDLVLESTKVPPKKQDNETSDEDSSQDVPDESRLVVDLGSIEAQVGDVCCYRIFFATTMMTPEMVKLLESPPHFKLREPITRAETLSVQPGSAA
jgi:hypothetical protein